MWTRLYAQSKVWLHENILYAVTYSSLIAVSFLVLFCYSAERDSAFSFQKNFCHVQHVEMCLKCAIVIQGLCSNLLKKKSFPLDLHPPNMSPLPIRSYHYCKLDLSKVHLSLHFIMVRLRVSASEIACLFLTEVKTPTLKRIS